MIHPAHPNGALAASLPKLSVLLVEDAESDARLLLEYVTSSTTRAQVDLIHVSKWSDAENSSLRLDAILLDLNLPDSEGLETVRRGGLVVGQPLENVQNIILGVPHRIEPAEYSQLKDLFTDD